MKKIIQNICCLTFCHRHPLLPQNWMWVVLGVIFFSILTNPQIGLTSLMFFLCRPRNRRNKKCFTRLLIHWNVSNKALNAIFSRNKLVVWIFLPLTTFALLNFGSIGTVTLVKKSSTYHVSHKKEESFYFAIILNLRQSPIRILS